MNEKKWHEDIPDGGVLCKHRNGITVLIKTAVGKWGFDISGINSHYLDDLTPLTAGEWWQFAPWQDMDSVPMDGSFILAIDRLVNAPISVRFKADKDGFFNIYGNRVYFDKWLPLPKV